MVMFVLSSLYVRTGRRGPASYYRKSSTSVLVDFVSHLAFSTLWRSSMPTIVLGRQAMMLTPHSADLWITM